MAVGAAPQHQAAPAADSVTKPISIVVRLRPFLSHDVQDDTITFPQHQQQQHPADRAPSAEVDARSVLVKNLRDPSVQSKYDFAAVHPAEDSQQRVFDSSVSPLLPDILAGRNLTLFAYGVTGSGKTWTMVGQSAGVDGGRKAKSRSKYSDGAEVAGEDEGVTPRLVRWLMSQKQERDMIRLGKKKKARSKKGQEEDGRKATEHINVELECYEIYNEMVFDLLVKDRPPSGLPVRENGERKVFVAGLSCQPVNSYADFLSLFQLANSHRSIGSTNLNAASSRSHMVISLLVQVRTIADPADDCGTTSSTTVISRVNLVDLAGSENNKLTGNSKERLTESSAINKSLFVLGQVVQALNTGASRIPYRDSKMTMIMRDALGGGGGSSGSGTSRAHGVLIANLAPGAKFYNDTVATLNFASRTKTVENRVGVNSQSSSGNSSSSSGHSLSAPPASRLTASQPAPARPLKPLASAALARSASQPKPTLGKSNGARAPLTTKNANIISQRPLQTLTTDAKPLKRPLPPATAAMKAAHASAEPKKARMDSATPASTSSNLKTPDYTALEARLEMLERRLAEQSASTAPESLSTSAALPDLLSPATRNKTARAAVLLARMAEEKGGVDALREALKHYEQALLYAPSNERLAGRVKECKEALSLGIDLKKLRAKRKREDKQGLGTAGAKAKLPRHLDIEMRMLNAIEGEAPLTLPLPPANQQARQGESGCVEQAIAASAAATTTADASSSRRAKTTAKAPRAGAASATAKPAARRVKRSSLDDEPDAGDHSSSSSSEDSDVFVMDEDDVGDESEYLVTVKPSARPAPARKAATRATKKVKAEPDVAAEQAPERELSPIRGDTPGVAEADVNEAEDEGDAVDSTFARAVAHFSYDGPAASKATPPVIHAAPPKARRKRKSASVDGADPTSTSTLPAEPKAKRTRKAADGATRTTPAKKTRRTKTPDSAEPLALALPLAALADPLATEATTVAPTIEDATPVDLSHIPITSIRPLVRCTLCARPFPYSRSGPGKLAHLVKCATTLGLSASTVSSTVETEMRRLSLVAAEEQRREEENKTLFEVTLKDRVVVRREAAKRASLHDDDDGDREGAGGKKGKKRTAAQAKAVKRGGAVLGLEGAGCEIQSPNRETRSEARRKAEALLGLPRLASSSGGQKRYEDEFDLDPASPSTKDALAGGGGGGGEGEGDAEADEKKFLEKLLSQRFGGSGGSRSGGSTTFASPSASAAAKQSQGRDDGGLAQHHLDETSPYGTAAMVPGDGVDDVESDAASSLPLQTQPFAPSRLAMRFSRSSTIVISSHSHSHSHSSSSSSAAAASTSSCRTEEPGKASMRKGLFMDRGESARGLLETIRRGGGGGG
ncbi:uncharacterized protein PFL1_05869 [Pseudozyma flocculosa PF-1]|uniref:Kinesin motor domain-containing protein n=2 Tax=Pseudozyma flocculosa TaxID=84751 RepID=A0A5C3F2D3_9BASI|nr:uncharacterized protein PFL1_05869 [Pseudozyma flocculosa PF-1]EPQ26547.1 hypothetical protein PFL1_05869 [Pseudozyma flocculosa PF-1]SPO38462.1 uncharacterized protein PSFLO_03940 [Pseudozyma flocculosa]